MKVLAFPCNQFGGQEPGTNAEIRAFAEGFGISVNTQGSSFMLMDKVDVNGPNEHPVWSFLKKNGGAGDVLWNFNTKFTIICGENSCHITRHDGVSCKTAVTRTLQSLRERKKRKQAGDSKIDL
mmetsp:Transcript_83438/g.226168  ORF Transcript_83438/g.226168 Transcript_83438/m.226168 type:complete len:124 (+) Transcript_83438:131-502(+)